MLVPASFFTGEHSSDPLLGRRVCDDHRAADLVDETVSSAHLGDDGTPGRCFDDDGLFRFMQKRN